MRLSFTILLILVFANISLAQFKISGVVIDSDKEILPGASITIDGTTIGTVSDINGKFEISGLKKGTYTLKASFIGYQPFIKNIQLINDLNIEAELSKNNVITDEVFVYSTRAGDKTPMATTEILKSQIKERNLGQDLPFILNNTPSFVSTSDGGAGIGYTGFRIRGTDANRINVTINGIPFNEAESHDVYWVDLPDFSSSIESIEIQRGVGTSTHGAAAFGATINLQTGSLKKDGYTEYSGSYGSFNTFKNTISVGSGLINDHFSFDARLSKISSDGFIDRAESDLKSFFISSAYYSENSILKLNIFSGKEKTYQAWNGVPSVRLKDDLEGMKRYEEHWLYSSEETQNMISSNSRTYNLYTYENQTDNYQQDHYQLLFSHKFGNYININAALHYTKGKGYYEQFEKDEDFSDYGLYYPVIGNDTISNTDLIRQKWLDNDFFGGTFSLNYKKGKSDIIFGAAWNEYIGNHFGNIIWSSVSVDFDKGYEWYRNKGIKTDFNVFLKYNYTLNDFINMYADVQYRNVNHSIEGKDDDLRDLGQDHLFDFFNPKLGVFYQPDKKSKTYLSWSLGHREPNRSNFTDADPNGKAPVFESLNDFELGYSYNTDLFFAGANLYLMIYDNQLILTGEINDVGSAIMTNVKNSYRSGIEISTGIKLFKSLEWNINATFSKNKILNFTEYVDDWDTGSQKSFEIGTTNIAFSPEITANSVINYIPLPNLKLSLISNYVGKQYIDNSSSDLRSLDAYFVNNFKISYTIFPKFVDQIELHLLINNILNEEYETNAWVYSYILKGERFAMDGFFPQAGINFLMGINFRF